MKSKFPLENRHTPNRRKILRYGAALGATAILPPTYSIAASAPLIKRAIPRTGEMLPIVDIGTSRVFDVGNDSYLPTNNTDVRQSARLIPDESYRDRVYVLQ